MDIAARASRGIKFIPGAGPLPPSFKYLAKLGRVMVVVLATRETPPISISFKLENRVDFKALFSKGQCIL